MQKQKTMVLGTLVESSASTLLSIDDVKTRQSRFVLSGLEDEQKVHREIDYSWLPLCADTYQISPDIQDYIFVSVPILSIDIPNRNLQAFSMLEVSNWDMNQGKATYKTFIGKPTYTNHKNNTIPNLAKGVHFDSSLEYVPAFNLYKVKVLLGFCRQKDAGLCEAIEANEGVTGYSMGAMVDVFLDSVSGKYIGLKDPTYQANKGKIDPKTQVLRYLLCTGATFFETSCLGDFGRGDPGEPPADHTATPDATIVLK